jgi:hypothetical protein
MHLAKFYIRFQLFLYLTQGAQVYYGVGNLWRTDVI